MKDQIKKNNANDSLLGLIIFIIGSIYLVLTLQLKEASIGNPVEPKYFPFIISVLLIVLGVYFLLKTGISQLKVSVQNIKDALNLEGDIYLTIAITSINCIVYALLFKKIGYILSTFVFLEVMLYLTRKEKWVSNIIVSTLFSIIIYFVFSKLLGVVLPPIPFLEV